MFNSKRYPRMKPELRAPFGRLLLTFCLSALLMSCGDEDVITDPPPNADASVYILCEGTRGADNSTLSRWNPESEAMENDVFRRLNPGLRLGDTANDMLLIGDTVFVAVDGSRTIEYFNRRSGEWLGRIIMPDDYSPRFLAGVSGDQIWASVALKHCVLPINLQSSTQPSADDCIAVGAAPEKMALHGNLLAVANSGFGTVFRDHPDAGTVSIIDTDTQRELLKLRPGPNTTDVCFNRDGTRLYAHYLHLPGPDWPKNDSLAGVVEYNVGDWRELRRWRLPSVMYDLVYDEQRDLLFTVTLDGLVRIDPQQEGDAIQIVYPKQGPENEHWYSLAYDSHEREFWIGNARNFVVGGQVLRVKQNGALLGRYEVGRNPGAFLFSRD